MQMIDFTDLPKRNKAYAGANGGKLTNTHGEASQARIDDKFENPTHLFYQHKPDGNR